MLGSTGSSRTRLASFALAFVASLAACDSNPKTAPAVTPATQKLDAGLADAYRAMKAGQWESAREKAAAYLREKGAAARTGQVEFVIGMTYQRQQLYGAAVEHFARAVELEPGFVETYYYEGYALFYLGRLAEARAALAIYAGHHPDEPNTTFAQGLVELEDDHVDAAERFIARAIEIDEKKKAARTGGPDLDDELGRFYARLGDVHLRRDEFARAKEVLAKAVSLRATSPETWHKLETACERLGDREGAERARRQYEELEKRREGEAVRPK